MSTFSTVQQFIDSITERFNKPRRSETAEGFDKFDLMGSLIDVGNYINDTNSAEVIEAGVDQVKTIVANTGIVLSQAEEIRVATNNIKVAVETMLANVTLAENPLGDYNATTNIPAISAIPPAAPGMPKGSWYRITENGTLNFAGSNFLTGAQVLVGGIIVKKSETQWFYQKPSDQAYAKAVANEALIYQKYNEVFNAPLISNGRTIVAKGNVAPAAGSKQIQADFLFDVSALNFGGVVDTYVFKCKILVKGNNIASIVSLLTNISSASGAGTPGGTQNSVGGAANPVNGVVLDYSVTKSFNAAKLNYAHNFINFDPIDEALANEIVVYDPTLTINGIPGTFLSCGLYSPNGTDTVTLLASLNVSAATKTEMDKVKTDSLAYTDTKTSANEILINSKFKEVFSPATVQGWKFLAKAGTVFAVGSKRIQPSFIFNVSAISWGGVAVDIVLSFKVLVKGGNIAGIVQAQQFFNESAALATTGAQLSTVLNITPVGDVVYNFTMTKNTNTAKTSYIHNFINFDPIDESAVTEIIIFSPVLTIGGVAAPYPTAALYSPNGTDTVTVITSISQPAASVDLVDSKIAALAVPAYVTGRRFVGKINSQNKVQPNFAFNTTGIPFTAASIGVFSCKILVRSNVASLATSPWFVNTTGAVSDTAGTQRTNGNAASAITANTILQYSSSLAMGVDKITNFVNIYLNFILIDTAQSADIIIYDWSFKIDGVAAVKTVDGLYASVAGDSIVDYTTSNILPTYDYVDKQFAAIKLLIPNSSGFLVNPLQGKILNAAGDSITAGSNGIGVTNTYCNVTAARNGMTINNYGMGGTRLTTDDATYGLALSNPDRYNAMSAVADYLTVFITTNDISANIPIGTNSDNTRDTIKGALNLLIVGLLAKYPTTRIGFLTPLNHKPTAYLYADAILDVCHLYAIPVLDLYREGGLYPINISQRNALMRDGTDIQHPAANGHLILASKYEAFLRRL